MANQSIFNALWPIVRWEGYATIVEVGVNKGDTSRLMLAQLDLNFYFLVDPWKEYSGGGAGSLARVDQGEWDQRYQDMIRLAQKDRRAKVIREESSKASKLFADHSVDMVFIDANHDYKNCYQDIVDWSPKIRPGGMLCGHDYSKHYPGVKEAVDELVPEAIVLSGSIWGARI